jgi:hypothetical protein
MLLLVFVALLVAFLVVLVLAKRFAFGAFFVSAGVFAMAGCAAADGLIINSDDPVSLRFVTLDESPLVAVQARHLAHRNDLVELREHIKYELRRGNITSEKAATLNHLIDETELEAAVDLPVGQAAMQQETQQLALVELTQLQAKLSETLSDTTNLVEALGSVRSPEFAGTLIAAKIQVVRLQAEKAAIDGTINEIRQSLNRPNSG